MGVQDVVQVVGGNRVLRFGRGWEEAGRYQPPAGGFPTTAGSASLNTLAARGAELELA
jgi:hypothetical protein